VAFFIYRNIVRCFLGCDVIFSCVFQPLRQPPLPLTSGDDVTYLLALQKEYLQTMRSSPFYVQAEATDDGMV